MPLLQCKIVSVDSSDEKLAPIIEQEMIDGFPTIALYKNGTRISDYNGDRNDKSVNTIVFILTHEYHSLFFTDYSSVSHFKVCSYLFHFSNVDH